MRKLKLGLLALLACLALVGCVAFAACGGDKDGDEQANKYTITWNLPEAHATVKAEGYDTLPTEAEEGTEITFTVTADNGYKVNVGPSNTVKEESGKYKFTVTKNTTIRVSLTEMIESVTATFAKEDVVYYAGQSLTAEDVTVTVLYKTERSETVPLSDCELQYGKIENEAFVATGDGESYLALGDRAITVTYRGETSAPALLKTLEDETAVVGLVKIDLYGGEITDAKYIAGLEGKEYDHYKYDEETAVISWTFNKPLAEEVILPTAEQISKVVNGNPFPFRGWSGVTGGKIAKNTAVSVEATAVYDVQLLDVKEIHITKKDNVPVLVVSGEWKAATEAYLYLYEGNDKIELKGTTVTKAKDSEEFELVYDITELVTKTPQDANPEAEKESFLGAWMDIKFRAKLNDREETQEIDLNNYDEDCVDLSEEVLFNIDGEYYKAVYKTHDGNSNGKYMFLKLDVEATEPLTVTNVTLEKRTVGEGDDAKEVAYYVIEGTYKGFVEKNADEVKTALEAIHTYTQNNNEANGMGWDDICSHGDQIIEIIDYAEGNTTFRVLLSLEKAVDESVVYAHFTNYRDNNGYLSLQTTNYDNEVEITITTGEKTLVYHLELYTKWGNVVSCYVVDPVTPKATINPITLEVEDNKVYYVITGTYKNISDTDFKANVKVDFEPNQSAGSSGATAVYDLASGKLTVDLEDGAYTVKVDITELEMKVYWVHLLGIPKANDKKDVGASDYGKDGEFVCNGKTYKYEYQWYGEWGAQVFVVEEATYAYDDITLTSYGLEEQDGKAVLVINGTVSNYVDKYIVYFATVRNANPWDNTVDKADVTYTFTNVDETEKTADFKIVWDLSKIPNGQNCWLHLGGSNKDLPSSKVIEGKDTLTVGSVKYEFQAAAPVENSPVLKVSAAD